MRGLTKILILIAFALAWPTTARAQLTLQSFNGTTGTPIGATYNFGNVASGSVEDIVFHALNAGNSAVVIDTLTLSGAGFNITAVNGTLPYTVAPENFLAFTVRFSAGSPAAYSAGLLVESISVLLLADSIAGPTVTFFPPCSLAGSNGVNFGTLLNGSLHLCNFSVTNENSQPLVISNISVTGAFQASLVQATPLTLAPGQGTDFEIEITPICGTGGALTGTLMVNTNRYTLTGQSADPPMPTPVLTLDTSRIGSGEQHSLTMSLASPAACAASGNVNLIFTPAPNLPVTDDTSIVFLSGSRRSLQFSASPGSSSVTIGGQSSAVFQTGTTAGTITFTVAGIPGASEPSISFAIAPAPISIETATASNQITGQLDVAIVGYDNTYSAGAMTFTFFDANNNMIGTPVTANFATNFQGYFAMYTSGSSFLANISFPVQGNALLVATVTVTLNNNAGQTQTGTLTFQ
jgi:hypothetical protein